MSARVGFTASDAERQTADSAANYMNRALRMIAERLALEKSLERDPAAFAIQFAPLLAALIEAQTREFQSWILSPGLETLAETHGRVVEDLASVQAPAIQAKQGGSMAAARSKINVDGTAENAADMAFDHAADWLRDACIAVEEHFGKGAAGKHPAFVAGFMVACAIAYHAEADWLRLALEADHEGVH